MKQCKNCLVDKPFTDYYTNGKQTSGKVKYHSMCKVCEESSRKSFVAEKLRLITEIFNDECKICGYSKCQSALEFHHIDPSVKEFTPAKLLGNFSTIETMLRELSKCILVCANCHREIHAGLL